MINLVSRRADPATDEVNHVCPSGWLELQLAWSQNELSWARDQASLSLSDSRSSVLFRDHQLGFPGAGGSLALTPSAEVCR